MKEFEELLSMSKNELDNTKLPDSQLNTFESTVFRKISKKKKQIKVNIAVSIIFTIFGAFFGYFMVNMEMDRGIKSIPIIADNKVNSIKKKKEEVWATDDIYFSTYDEKATYAIEQVSLTGNDGDI